MTQTYPAAATQSASPFAAPVWSPAPERLVVEPAPRHLRGGGLAGAGVALALLGAAVALLGLFVVAPRSIARVDDFARVPVAGTGTLVFARPGTYVAYYEARGVGTGSRRVPLVGIRLTAPDGTTRTLQRFYGGYDTGRVGVMTYRHDGHDGIALYEFTITSPGRYTAVTTPSPAAAGGSAIAVGPSLRTGATTAALLAVLGAVGFVAGLAVSLTGLRRRRRHRRLLRPRRVS